MLGIASRLDIIKVYGQLCLGHIQLLHYFMWKTWASLDFALLWGFGIIFYPDTEEQLHPF